MKHQDPQDGHSEQRGMGDDGREWILTRSQDGLMLADRAGRCYCCWWWVVMLWSEQFWCGWSGGEEKSAGVVSQAVSPSVSQAGRPSLRGLRYSGAHDRGFCQPVHRPPRNDRMMGHMPHGCGCLFATGLF